MSSELIKVLEFFVVELGTCFSLNPVLVHTTNTGISLTEFDDVVDDILRSHFVPHSLLTWDVTSLSRIVEVVLEVSHDALTFRREEELQRINLSLIRGISIRDVIEKTDEVVHIPRSHLRCNL